ncbi:hypothetical protein GCM10009839_17770 [Catenulispora yoronensis]|uniref:PBS lyase n=1 Tax=Catenulispora yoronensis TaxID=450799 RepID=A0ABP5FBH8_9ACTN
MDNNYLPNGYDPARDRATLEAVRGEADEWTRWISEAADDEQRRQREVSCAQVLIDVEAAVRSYDAVREALPVLSVLLGSDSPELRAETANLLAWFPEHATTSVPLLEAFIAGEASPGAAATGIVALSLLGEPATVPFIRRYLDSPTVELRWASAFALTRFGMFFLSGSYISLATMALAATSEATTLRGVDAVLVRTLGPAGQAGVPTERQPL